MASPALTPDYSKIELSMRDAWMLYRLAYFPRVNEARRRSMLNESGVTDAGRRIGKFLLGDDVGDLSPTERYVAERYQTAAKRERLDLPSGSKSPKVRGSRAAGA